MADYRYYDRFWIPKAWGSRQKLQKLQVRLAQRYGEHYNQAETLREAITIALEKTERDMDELGIVPGEQRR